MPQKMTILEAMQSRHSVRQFAKTELSSEDCRELQDFMDACNAESGLRMQLVTNDSEAFRTLLNHYGWLRNPKNYIALVGKDTPELSEQCGYYGEKLVLFAQQIGLSTCWLGGTFNRKKTSFEAAEGEKLCLIIVIGYAEKDGKPHKNRPMNEVSNLSPDSPDWFRRGMEGAMTAPTAVNQQKFFFELLPDGKVKTASAGAFGQVDLGIAKYHFELASGKDHSIWC